MDSFQLILIAFFLFLCCSSYADDYSDGDRGSMCTPGMDNSTWSNAVQINLNNVVNTLEQNVNFHSGFYTTTAGEKSDKIYGLIQCRGDVSALNCANCTREAFKLASDRCYKSKSAIIWQKWCYLRYSNQSFFGVWEKSAMAVSNDTDVDEPFVASKGLAMMGTLVSTTPKEPLMFAVSELDVERSGKRYGMAQCTRDLSRSDCGQCLDYVLASFGMTVGHKKGWEAYGVGCSMWYNNYRFYSNFSTPKDAGLESQHNAAQRQWTGRFAVGIITLTTMSFLVFL
ncbi:Cysteine-rich repeat secretory protein 55 [Forsythia ovata]|uniref:Cysteine-rich repeat secretory protein 55 n=1 Tax=Forsythia ovata TaxID=205694 RepID=A0ABD1S3H9_9LAMI